MVLVTGMAAPLSGIRVLEVANWLAAPAAGALLADLGADVIKVEPPGGDVFREFLLRSMGYTHEFATNYAFQLDNRGKTMCDGKFNFGFAIDWMRKDLGICLDEARRNGSRLPVAALVDQFYAAIQANGGGRWDTSSLMTLLSAGK